MIKRERNKRENMPKKKKIIILYSTAGMGHKKAALAIYDAFQKRNAEVSVEVIDILEYASNTYKHLYLNFYVFMMSRAKWLWAFLYHFSDIPLVDIMTRKVRGVLDFRGMSAVGPMLAEKKPAAIIATHFFLPSVAAILKKYDDLNAKMYTLITDYGPHSYWLSDYVDEFFVGSEPAARNLEKRGVPANKITATGISTSADFTREFDKDALRKVHGVDRDKKTVFLMSGGFGVGPIEKMLLSLNSCSADIQVIAVCGHNKTVYEDMEHLQEKLKYPLVLFGLTDKVAELMAISDLMITKAGGISVTEALNARLPMILFGSIPGQETWNEEFLISNGAAEKAKRIEDIPLIANRILISDEEYDSFMAGIDKIRKPNAAKDIVEIVLKDMGK